MLNEVKNPMRPPLALCRRFLAERRGAAAVEFALIVPLMLVLYLLSMEFSLAIEVSKKVNRIASQVADLVTQQRSITPTQLEAIIKIGDATLQPFRGTPTVRVTALEVTMENDAPVAKVVWSQKWTGGSLDKYIQRGTVDKDVPKAYMVPGTFLIRSEAELQYFPVIAPAQGSNVLGISDTMFPIEMGGQQYMMPRMTQRIECADCS